MAMTAPFSCFRHQGPSRRHRAWPCHARPDTAPATPESSRGKQLKKALTLSTAISFASLFDVSPARAHGMHCNTQWVPRRHYRGLKEERRPPKFKRVDLDAQEEASTGVTGTLIHVTKALQEKFSSEEEGFTLRATGSSRSGQVTLPGMNSAVAMPQSPKAAGATPVWVPIVAATLFAVIAFWSKIRDFFMNQGGRPSGKWVRDRSLGGKMVFIADDIVPSTSRKPSGASALPDANAADGMLSSQRLSNASQSSWGTSVESTRPSWWVYTPPLPLPEATKLEYRKRAKRVLKQLENQKLVDGKDYDPLALIQLFKACRDGGTDVASSVATEAGREAMFRQGISSTIKVTADGSGVAASALARSFKPRDFVCGLAIALGVSEARAIKMVHAVIAADARGRLLDVSASRRKGELQDAAAGIQALVRILEAFPLPTSAAEASLVGAALRDKITLAETEDLLKQLAFDAPEMMELFTVMLGFDVELTLPMLEQYIASSKGNNQ